MISFPPRPSELTRSRDPTRKGLEPSFVCILRFELPSLRHYRRSLRLRSDRAALLALARALAASEPWQSIPGTTFTVRPEPDPVIGIVSGQTGLDPAGLLPQAQAYESAAGRLRYIEYREVETAVRRLGGALIEQFGLAKVRGFRYAAVPRGGLIVLGLLTAHLGVPADRVAAAPADSTGDAEPLVVVDDCALSGARFADFLGRCPARRVIFAHLYSHPALREALSASEPRVLACLAGQDLRDEGSERLAGDWSEARGRWRQRLPGRYWLGDCERIAFPWNEPDRVVWNPETREVELGWKLVPPERCLKRSAGPAAAARPHIQLQPRGTGLWRPASTVLFAWHRGETIVHRLDTGELFRLPGTAHAMWWALLRGGDLAPALHLLRARYHVADETLAADLRGFFATLQARNLFAREPS
jgi:hypothetical protein